jgi:hypothetical protein
MKKILTVYLHFFRNEAHGEFMVVVRNLIQKISIIQTLLAMYFTDFKNLIEKEQQLINAMGKSDYTAQIADAGHRVDRTIVGMNEVLASALHHFDVNVVNAAKSLRNRFDDFGNIAKKSYEEETYAVNLLITDLLSADYAAKVNTVGLKPWLTELQAAEAAFELLFGQRNVETFQKPQGTVREVRHDLDVIYRKMADRVNAAATMDSSNSYDAFIGQLNVEIAYFNDHYHHPAKDLSVGGACVIEAIKTQIYSGKPLTPLTKVYFHEEGKPAVELVFARDYFVTYKNNIEVGTATLAIHGKGAYRGQVTVKFNIARVPEPGAGEIKN